MSENDSDSGPGSGRKGFVRDVMRRIAPSTSGRPGDEPESDPRRPGEDRSASRSGAPARRACASSAPIRPSSAAASTACSPSTRRSGAATSRFARSTTTPSARTRSSSHTLQEAKQQIELLKEEVDKLCAPPNTYGVFIRANKDGTAEIVVDGRADARQRPSEPRSRSGSRKASYVVLNEAFNVIEPRRATSQRGEIATIIDDARRRPRHRARATPTTSAS